MQGALVPRALQDSYSAPSKSKGKGKERSDKGCSVPSNAEGSVSDAGSSLST